MDTGMAPLAKGNEVLRCIIGAVAVLVVDVEIFFSPTEHALVSVPCQNDFPKFFPFFQAVFVPYCYR